MKRAWQKLAAWWDRHITSHTDLYDDDVWKQR